MMNTALKEVLMTLNSSYVRAAEQSVSAEQSYREGLREMQQKIQELEERDALHVKAIRALNRTKQNRTDARGKQPAYQIAFSTGLTHITETRGFSFVRRMGSTASKSMLYLSKVN